MIKTSDLLQKEVINIVDGKSLGYIIDIDVDFERGRINSIILPNQEKVLGFFGKEVGYEILWRDIKKIGIDVILVELKNTIYSNEEMEEMF
ncbi:MAG: YlmC/YmxH family sporulation protein [Clostridiales bacterium]|nr:YlmC/YmxH family sporulation protein [Clostridiales bacterium]